jgi:hypothetical protein
MLDQKIIDGVDKYFAKVKTLTLAGTVYTPKSLKAVLQAEIDATKSLASAKAQIGRTWPPPMHRARSVRCTQEAEGVYLPRLRCRAMRRATRVPSARASTRKIGTKPTRGFARSPRVGAAPCAFVESKGNVIKRAVRSRAFRGRAFQRRTLEAETLAGEVAGSGAPGRRAHTEAWGGSPRRTIVEECVPLPDDGRVLTWLWHE